MFCLTFILPGCILNTVVIRTATESDVAALVELLTRSVHEIASNSYSPSQLHSWAPVKYDVSLWTVRFQNLETYIAEVDTQAAGFISILAPAHIELLYTHPQFSRQGIASALYKYAIDRLPESAQSITTDASLEAKPFFEKQGLSVVKEEYVERNGQAFKRFQMST